MGQQRDNLEMQASTPQDAETAPENMTIEMIITTSEIENAGTAVGVGHQIIVNSAADEAGPAVKSLDHRDYRVPCTDSLHLPRKGWKAKCETRQILIPWKRSSDPR